MCVVLYRRRREPLTTAIQPMPRSSKPQADSHQHGRQLAALSSVSRPGAVIISAPPKLHGGRFDLPRLPPLTFQLCLHSYSIKIMHGCPYGATIHFVITPLSPLSHALLLVCKLHGGRFDLPRLPLLTFQLCLHSYSIKIMHGCPYGAIMIHPLWAFLLHLYPSCCICICATLV